MAVLAGLISAPTVGHPYRGVLDTGARCPVWITDGGLSSLRAGPVGLDPRDAEAILAARWPGDGVFPGLAPALTPAASPVPTGAPGRGHLALVPVARPADVPAALGWRGADDPAALGAVLRSWEDRFGAYLVQLDLATIELAVAAPPVTGHECRAVAMEHVAFCRDLDLRAHAGTLAGMRRWRLRWS